MVDCVDRVLVSRETIQEAVTRLGKQISADYQEKQLVMIGVLKGGFVFLADLVRSVSIPVQMDFIAVSSYGASTKSSGVVQLIKDVDMSLVGKHILLVEDIIDTGLTLSYLKDLFQARNPLSVKVCSIFDKPSRRKIPFAAEYTGIELPDEYVVGYGLDYNGYLRNLPDLCVLKRERYAQE